MSCDHKFVDSTVCLKCGKSFADLKREDARARAIMSVTPPEEVREWIFTFGYGQHHPLTGAPLDGHFVRISGTFSEARAAMVARFGTQWSFQRLSEEDAGVKRFGLTELEQTGAHIEQLERRQAQLRARARLSPARLSPRELLMVRVEVSSLLGGRGPAAMDGKAFVEQLERDPSTPVPCPCCDKLVVLCVEHMQLHPPGGPCPRCKLERETEPEVAS